MVNGLVQPDVAKMEVGGNFERSAEDGTNDLRLRKVLQMDEDTDVQRAGGSLSQSAIKQLKRQKLLDRIQSKRLDFLRQVDSQLGELFDEVTQEVDTFQQPFTNGNANVQRDSNSRGQKTFVPRDSILTDLFEMQHIQTIYHIFVAILIVLMINTFVYDIVDKGSWMVDFSMVSFAFDRMPIVLHTWVYMQLATIVVYCAFNHWAHNRNTYGTWFDWLYCAGYLGYQAGFGFLPLRQICYHSLPPTAALIVVCEQVRMVMKVHSFVRENAPKVLKTKGVDGPKQYVMCPDFSKYLYFLFAPTLVYRDEYPRTPSIRWNYVVSNFGQVVGCLVYANFVLVRFMIPVFRNIGKEPTSPKVLVLAIFGSMLPGMLVLFLVFFGVLHSWLNAFAEMLRFADRQFYKDWWNSTSFAGYYRSWNVVVHDWLYYYIYKDIMLLLGYHNKTYAALSVFVLSAIVHEYIIAFALGFFYPVLLCMFGGIGVVLFFLVPQQPSRMWNIGLWVGLFIGMGLLMCLYCQEWYARINCPRVYDSYADYLIPRSWTCMMQNVH
ncbi:sterol O-acyltransferase 1-like isoform X2 [Branchiostoma floridae]|uniref:Sterol O-acyltransferase 1-like isoform X2 n=1 Tax=Branchiostoma floridae TaxID=7739 RepID=A0A9J7LUG5_BRAFL|nr:sterol O-acyltransferase 1-like isoform X2 [Branchiostoma floridae]